MSKILNQELYGLSGFDQEGQSSDPIFNSLSRFNSYPRGCFCGDAPGGEGADHPGLSDTSAANTQGMASPGPDNGGLLDGIAGFFGAIAKGIAGVVGGLVDTVGSVVGGIVDSVGAVVGGVVEGLFGVTLDSRHRH